MDASPKFDSEADDVSGVEPALGVGEANRPSKQRFDILVRTLSGIAGWPDAKWLGDPTLCAAATLVFVVDRDSGLIASARATMSSRRSIREPAYTDGACADGATEVPYETAIRSTLALLAFSWAWPAGTGREYDLRCPGPYIPVRKGEAFGLARTESMPDDFGLDVFGFRSVAEQGAGNARGLAVVDGMLEDIKAEMEEGCRNGGWDPEAINFGWVSDWMERAVREHNELVLARRPELRRFLPATQLSEQVARAPVEQSD